MIIVLLPAYNEEIALEKLVRKFDSEFKSANTPYRIVVVDDGSKDRTAEIGRKMSQEYPVELLQHEVNKGLGQTMIDGLEHVSKNSQADDLIVTLDCDDTHEPQYVHSAIKKIGQGADVVVLSRYQEGGGEEGLSPFKSFLSKGAGWFLRFFFPIKGVKEYSCGYRVFRASAIKQAIAVFGKDFVRLPKMGFVVTPEILIKLRMLGCKIEEVPFVLHYDQKAGVSKNKPLKTIAGYFALVGLYWGRKVKS